MLERIAFALEIDNFELFSAVPFPSEAIQTFQKGIKADIEERLAILMKANKLTDSK